MNHRTEQFSQRLDAFFQSHHKQCYPENRLVILELYHELVSLLEGEAAFVMEDHETSMTITISAPSFLSSQDFPALQDLIHEATTFDARIQDGKIVFVLYFTFWKWVPNTLSS